MLLDAMKNCVTTRNTLEVLLLENTLEYYSTDLVEYKKLKYSCNYLSSSFRSSRVASNSTTHSSIFAWHLTWVEKVSFLKNTFVEKQSQIRLSFDEFWAFNHFFITNSKFVSIVFANNNNFFDDNNFFDFNSTNTREIFVEKIIYDKSIKSHSNLVVMIVNINFFVQTTIIVAI